MRLPLSHRCCFCSVSAEGMTLVTITRNKKDADATNIASLVDIIKVFFFLLLLLLFDSSRRVESDARRFCLGGLGRTGSHPKTAL